MKYYSIINLKARHNSISQFGGKNRYILAIVMLVLVSRLKQFYNNLKYTTWVERMYRLDKTVKKHKAHKITKLTAQVSIIYTEKYRCYSLDWDFTRFGVQK